MNETRPPARPGVSPGAPVAPLGEPDLQALRREVMSYRFEVEQLIVEYQALARANRQLAPHVQPLVDRYNTLVRSLSASTFWRVTRPLRGLVHRLRHGEPLVEDLAEVRLPAIAGAGGDRTGFPVLPDLPQIDYVSTPSLMPKTWESTRFLSEYYYNQLDRILARDPARSRRIFVQTPIIDWFVPLFQRPQHMARAMAKQGYLVFYQTANTLGDRAQGFHEVEPNVFITNQPVHLMLEGALMSFYSTVATLLSWQGATIDKVRARGNRVLYEYIDHIDPEISFHTTDALARQFALVSDETIDLGLASARTLCDELGAKLGSTPMCYVPNGVDVGHYRGVADVDRRGTVPRRLAPALASGRPVVGYFGAMAPWLWYEAINALAKARPDLEFVYIGPDYLGGSDKLARLPNLHALGAVDYMQLPYHAQHFDACIIPFKPGDIARTTSPLKLFEYFALGKPVVVTAEMTECVQFPEVLPADSADAFSAQIDRALALARDPGFVARVRALADANTWDARAHTLAGADAALVASATQREGIRA